MPCPYATIFFIHIIRIHQNDPNFDPNPLILPNILTLPFGLEIIYKS